MAVTVGAAAALIGTGAVPALALGYAVRTTLFSPSESYGGYLIGFIKACVICFRRYSDIPRSPWSDLDGDGISLIGVTTSGVHFDLNADGSAESAGWPGDRPLARDGDGDTRVSQTSLETARPTVSKSCTRSTPAATGCDLGWRACPDGLRVWRDPSQNGSVDAGEPETLAESGSSPFRPATRLQERASSATRSATSGHSPSADGSVGRTGTAWSGIAAWKAAARRSTPRSSNRFPIDLQV